MAIEDTPGELGTTSGIAPAPWTPTNGNPTDYVVDPLDHNPELRFPMSAAVYDRMRRSDAQVGANLRAMGQAINGFPWQLVGASDVPADVIEFIRGEIGLVPTDDARKRRRREGIVFTEHLREALLCLPYGFSAFEQVYSYSTVDRRLHLRKLAARPATTIKHISVGRDGGLAGLIQEPPVAAVGETPNTEDVFIPVEHLVWYVLEREGADWTGVSVLRTAYKAWYIKEHVERLSAQIVERNGMGIPTAYAPDNLSPAARAMLDQTMASFRAGEKSHAVLPEGVVFDVKGVSGGTVDPLPVIRHFDQQISKSMLAMFLDLGHDAGARSLGETMLHAFETACHAVAEHIGDVFTEHVIRDLVELNYGPDMPYPILTPGPKPEAAQPAVEAPQDAQETD